MRDEHLDTILATKSDEFIKSSVEDLVPSPSESEDLSDSECDVPTCDDFTNFSNLLFDAENDFSSSDDELFSDEDILKKIYSNPLFDEKIIFMKIDPHHFNAESDLIESLLNHDSSIISSSLKIDSLLDEFAGVLILLKSILLKINETDCNPEEEICLIEKLLFDNSSPRPPEEFISKNSNAAIESFFPSPIPVEDSDSFMEEIDLSFTPDDSMPLGIENDDYDSEVDILIPEELLSLPDYESFHFDIPSSSRPPTKRPDDNLRILTVKVVDDISELCFTSRSIISTGSLPESETFCFDSEENSSGSTTTRADISLLDYEAFYDDYVKEISSRSTTNHSDFSLYDSFIFDLSINSFPPADRSDFYEFADELTHIISPPEYDCFSFKN
nr:hypothetical protein [Tanacetum cinerariifolium]